MRPIKFRFWNPEDKCFSPLISPSIRYCSDSSIDWYMYKNAPKDLSLDVTMINYSLIPQQFTGLLDIHGKEIYEGDILKIKNTDTENKYPEDIRILEVKWGDYDDGEYVSNIECWMAGSYQSVSELLARTKYKYNTWQLTVEKIGNIFENPELIEKK